MSIRNQVSLVGRITRDLEVKSFDNDSKVLNFSIAVDDSYLNKSTGEEVKKSYFLNCVSRNKMADHIFKNYKKGYQIAITGKLTSRSYDNNGQTVYVTEVEILTADILLRREVESQS